MAPPNLSNSGPPISVPMLLPKKQCREDVHGETSFLIIYILVSRNLLLCNKITVQVELQMRTEPKRKTTGVRRLSEKVPEKRLPSWYGIVMKINT